MLDFIVLGQVPGTQIYLSFTSTVLFISLMSVACMYIVCLPVIRKPKTSTGKEKQPKEIVI